MTTTKTKKLNVSRAINDAVKLCELIRKTDKAYAARPTARPSFKAYDKINKHAEAVNKRYGKKIRIFNRMAHGARVSYRYLDIQIFTGKMSDVTISERSRLPRTFPSFL